MSSLAYYINFEQMPGDLILTGDEIIADNIEMDGWPLTVKISGFSPKTLSIGYFQNIEQEINIHLAQKRNIPIMRRPSGGGAVLHAQDEEITFAIIIHKKNLGNKTISESYSYLLQPLLNTLSQLNINSEINKFGDIIVNKRKISGSAQLRRKNVVIFHGYIMIDTQLTELYSLINKNKEKLNKKGLNTADWATTVKNEIGNIKRSMFQNNFLNNIKETFNVDFKTIGYSKISNDVVERSKKYQSEKWTYNYY